MAKAWWDSWVPAVQPYAVLLRLLVAGTMTASEFEVVFLRLYKSDGTEWSPDLFDVLDSFFADVDDYVAEDSLRLRAGGIDANELRLRGEQTLSALERLAG